MDINVNAVELKQKILTKPHLKFIETCLQTYKGKNDEKKWQSLYNCIKDDSKM